MIDVASLQAQTARLRVAFDKRHLLPANDNDPPDPPPAISIRLPRIRWLTVNAVGRAA